MIAAPGYETLVTHVFSAGDEYLDSDAVFGVKNSLIRDFTRQPPGKLPDGSDIATPWRHLTYDFGLKPLAQQQAA
jgi:hydroxyquinol 1,2-dioxygenase